MLCLQSAVEHLALPPNIAPAQSPTHARSTSYTPALLRQTAVAAAASSGVLSNQDRKGVN